MIDTAETGGRALLIKSGVKTTSFLKIRESSRALRQALSFHFVLSCGRYTSTRLNKRPCNRGITLRDVCTGAGSPRSLGSLGFLGCAITVLYLLGTPQSQLSFCSCDLFFLSILSLARCSNCFSDNRQDAVRKGDCFAKPVASL